MKESLSEIGALEDFFVFVLCVNCEVCGGRIYKGYVFVVLVCG